MRQISSFSRGARHIEQFETFVHFVAGAKTFDETKAILETLITFSEKAALGQRLAILRKLHKGETYQEIQLELSISPSTVAGASDLYLKSGQYNKIFDEQLSKFKYQPEIKLTSPEIKERPIKAGFRSDLYTSALRKGKSKSL